MGQAKRRGTREQRVERAHEAAKGPPVKCNNCGADIPNTYLMDVSEVPGLRMVAAGICDGCHHETWAFDGEPEVVQAFAEFQAQEHGDDVKLALQRYPRNPR